ncbi:hypothetical protein [Burkholderia lata]|uniref:hypothetical protein n=1 Tax=Burkholderia lata (strain ATCC 17760 / DSM 23089 / LMG 22485 / NCIMB 9086 / R18194 / 383) TaxID=482957 RepID=UPI00399B7B14
MSVVLSLPDVRFLVSGIVRGESKSIVSAVDAVIADGILGLVDDDLISMRTFRAAKERFGLGAGETECILAAELMGCVLACDDLAARSAAKKSLGAGQVRGSIGLLRMAVDANTLNREAAYLAYQLMRNRGGYLPELSPADF